MGMRMLSHLHVPSSLSFGVLVLAASAVPSSLASGAPHDWPQYRGPQHDGTSLESGWKVEGATESLWKASVGLGYSSVAVSNGRLYTLGFDKDAEKDVIYCLDALTGEERWAYPYPAKIWNQFHGGGSLTTPSVDDGRVFVSDREGIFLCLDAETGEEIWKQDLQERYGVKPPTWGFSASPLVLDDMLVLNVGKTIAVDKKTGEKLWETRDSGHAYSTPIDFTLAGNRALAVFNGSGLAVFGLAKGDELYFHEWKVQYEVNASTPVVVGEKLFISSGGGKGCALLAPGEKEKSVVFENKEMRTSMAGCVLWKDHLYGFDDKVLKCIDLTGAEKWKERDIEMGALIVADGKLLVMDGAGELIVAPASPEKFEALSRTKVLDGGVYWTTPTLANGLIYCRSSLGDLVCRDHRAKAKN